MCKSSSDYWLGNFSVIKPETRQTMAFAKNLRVLLIVSAFPEPTPEFLIRTRTWDQENIPIRQLSILILN